MLKGLKWQQSYQTEKNLPRLLTSPVVCAHAVLRELTRVAEQFAVEVSVPVAKVEDGVVVVDGKVTVGGGVGGIDRGGRETEGLVHRDFGHGLIRQTSSPFDAANLSNSFQGFGNVW